MNQIDYRFPVVIDNGSFSNKIGFVGELAPRSVIRTLITENQNEK
jgi:actin-related protein